MRLAVTRAADATHSLTLTVTGLEEEVLDLDAMLETIAAEMLLVGMVEGQTLMGISALDAQLRNALIEVQTVGAVLSGPIDERPPTGTDATMAEPLLQAILSQLEETAARTPLDGWGQGLGPMGRVIDTRAAGLILPERPYRIIRLTLDLQVEGRQGTLVMALPDHLTLSAPEEKEELDVDWTTRFQAAVNAAPVRLAAELHRFKAPLFAVEAMKVGEVIPLTGCTISSVKLRAADGRKVASARLGQAGGMRAVRIAQADLPGMDELAELGADVSPGLPMMDDPGAMSLGLEADAGMGEDFGMGDGAGFDMDDTPIDMSAGFSEVGTDAGAGDETSQMLDEMEAALELDGEEGAAPAELDWSAEFAPSEMPEAE